MSTQPVIIFNLRKRPLLGKLDENKIVKLRQCPAKEKNTEFKQDESVQKKEVTKHNFELIMAIIKVVRDDVKVEFRLN